jgi:hypothetical protein
LRHGSVRTAKKAFPKTHAGVAVAFSYFCPSGLADFLFLADKTFCWIGIRLNTIKFIPNPTGTTTSRLELL